MRHFFQFLNKFFMVPIFLLGLGPIFGNPFSGYILVLKVIGRKTGKLRYTPVNYTMENGNLYCLAGFGHISDWYRNIKARRDIEVILPTGCIYGMAYDVLDISVRKRVIRKILKNAGFAGFLEGFNPYSVSDEEIMSRTGELPLVRIQPNGLGNGAYDPGGWAWVWGPILTTLAILLILAIFR